MDVRPGEILTYSGRYVTPLDLQPEQVDINDIAHALSMQCRFSGHTSEFYSVAQHSVLCAQYLVNRRADLDVVRLALLHDAPEYVLQDMARPLKEDRVFGAEYRQAEQKAFNVIAEAFELVYLYHPQVKEADLALLALERAVLMPQNGHWGLLDGVTLPLDINLEPWPPYIAKERFLEAFEDLFLTTHPGLEKLFSKPSVFTNHQEEMPVNFPFEMPQPDYNPDDDGIDVISLEDFLAGRLDKAVPVNSPEGQAIVGNPNNNVLAETTYGELEEMGYVEKLAASKTNIGEMLGVTTVEVAPGVHYVTATPDGGFEVTPINMGREEPTVEDAQWLTDALAAAEEAERAYRAREIDADLELGHVEGYPVIGERHPNSARFHELLQEAGAMHDRKQADYGRGDDPFANVRASEEWGVDGWIGALVRLNDKVRRLQSLSQKGHLVNESALDSLMDIAVYALIAYVLYEQQYGQ